MRVLPLLALVAVVVAAGCLSVPPHRKPGSSDPGTKAYGCVPVEQGTSDATQLGGQFYAADSHLWQESNGLSGLQEHRTCEGDADTDLS